MSKSSYGLLMRQFILALNRYQATDLHLKVNKTPMYRVRGQVVPTRGQPLTHDQVKGLILEILPKKKIAALERREEVDFSFSVEDAGRFRCNAYFHTGLLSAAIRKIPTTVPTLEQIGVPEILKEFAGFPRGLVLVTGATGAGKSTTLAAMVQHINETSHSHIITLEDPIEFMFSDQKASITQREIGTDTGSLEAGLIASLRQDPDVIVIGELRELGAVKAALTAAETGHLVLATLHTRDARSTIHRIVSIFPAENQNQIRAQLSNSLCGIVSQLLLNRADKKGFVPACEVMIKSPAIESYIFENRLENIPDAIESSKTYYGMQSMNQALEELVRSERVTLADALSVSPNPGDLKLRLEGVGREQGY